MNCPMEEEKPLRNQTFITSRSSWEPTIRHQDLNTFPVLLEAPMENAKGDV